MQTVEQKMRVDLHAQGLQLRVPGQRAGLRRALGGLLGSVSRQRRVVQAAGQKIQDHAHAEQRPQLR